MGISSEDWDLLKAKVTVIFHIAATIKFTEPIKLYPRGKTAKITRVCADGPNSSSFLSAAWP
jgi:hypothetical protein